jgi:hypothetical protein
MNSRLYRREPVKRGDWYYSVSCKGCAKPIYILDDPAKGKNGVPIFGDGLLLVACLRCAEDTTYSVPDLVTVQSDEDIIGARPTRVATSPSPRKPLWKAYPKAKAIFGVGYIEDRPAASALVGRIVTSWANLEVESACLLAELMGTNIPAAAAVFGALRNSRTQHDALIAAAQVTLDAQDLELFEAHEARKATLEKERNDLAHGCFGISVSIPDHIIWAAQVDYLMFSATKSDYEEFRRKIYVYELGTLERIAQEMDELYQQLGFFRGYLSARHDGIGGQSFRILRYRELCSQPHIRQTLDRIRTAKKR